MLQQRAALLSADYRGQSVMRARSEAHRTPKATIAVRASRASRPCRRPQTVPVFPTGFTLRLDWTDMSRSRRSQPVLGKRRHTAPDRISRAAQRDRGAIQADPAGRRAG